MVQEVFNENPENTESITKKLHKLKGKKAKNFSDKEILKLVDAALDCNFPSYLSSEKVKLKKVKKHLIKTLSKFNVTGIVDFAVDPNFAFIFDSQNPGLNVNFKDDTGKIKRKRYKTEINSLGFKFELAIKLDLIFLVNTDFHFYETDGAIELGFGIDANIVPFVGCNIGITYAPFEKISGGILILSIPLFFAGPSLSLVTGGYLFPIA